MSLVATLLLTLICGIACIGGVLLVRRSYGRGTHAEPACARCGYPVRGLKSWECPECGADLQRVGTTSPSRGRPPSRLAAHAWALLFTVIGLVFLGGLLRLVFSVM